MRSVSRTHYWALLAISILVVAAGVLGLGRSSGSASSTAPIDVKGATAAVVAAEKIPTFKAPGPAFQASKAKGKTIFSIPQSSSIPFVAAVDAAQAKIAKVAGINYISFPNQGSPTEWISGFNQAIARKVNLIILTGGGYAAEVQPSIKKAEAAGIPVIATHYALKKGWPAGTLPSTYWDNLSAIVPGPFKESAQLEADYTIAHTPGGKVHAMLINTLSDGIIKYIQNEYKSRCGSGCKTTVVNISSFGDWATKMQAAVQSALLKDPSINWVIPIYDGMVQFAAPGVKAAHKQKSVRISTYNGSDFVLKMLQNKDVVASDIGESNSWIAWAAMDQALRLLSGKPAVNYTASASPVRLFDSGNVAAGLGKAPFGNAFPKGYLKLWGLLK